MTKFTMDNTEGYNAAELAELNKRYEDAIAGFCADELADKSLTDRIAERVQQVYDDERTMSDVNYVGHPMHY